MTSNINRTAPGSRLKGVGRPIENDSDLVAWAERIALLGVGRSIPELIVRLERLRASQLDLDTRYRILRGIKRPLLEAAARIPRAKRPQGIAATDRTPARTLKQRLFEAITGNLQRLLADLDRAHKGLAQQAGGRYSAERHRWVLRNLFRFIERELVYTVRVGTPWSPGVWQTLHDLFVYLVVRGHVRLNGEAALPDSDCGFDAEYCYKRLVMIGLAVDLFGGCKVDSEIVRRLDEHAKTSRLVESDGLVGEYGLVLVEVGQDAPARVKLDPLIDPFRGWVLRVPVAYLRLLPEGTGFSSEIVRLQEPLGRAS